MSQGRNVLRKEPMSKDINESDHFVFNSSFHSKFYKVKIGTVSAQKETEPEKQETRQKVTASPAMQHWTRYSPYLADMQGRQRMLRLSDRM